jgi:HSP20 family molecular chaperone IbpA
VKSRIKCSDRAKWHRRVKIRTAHTTNLLQNRAIFIALVWPGACHSSNVMTAAKQCVRKQLEEPVTKRHGASCGSTVSVKLNASRNARSLLWRDEPPLVLIAEGPSEYKLVVPLAAIDPRKIYVFAAPHALLIEIRLKSTICHPTTNAPVTEAIDRRISREFNLPIEIERGRTKVEMHGESLHITARKSQETEQASWSELVHLDTRPSWGCR